MAAESPPAEDCEFCEIIRGEEEARIVVATPEVVAFFPLEPATLGHTLLVPRRHVPDLWSLDPGDAGPLAVATVQLARAIQEALQPEGLNVINSTGEAATQSVFHLHVHLVPRWRGDHMGRIWPPATAWSETAKDETLQALRDASSRLVS